MQTFGELKSLVESKVQYINFDFQFSFNLCLIEKLSDKAFSYLIAEMKIPLNSQNKTNLAYSLPLLTLPIGVGLLIDLNQTLHISKIDSIKDKQGRGLEDVFQFAEIVEPFHHQELLDSIKGNIDFLNQLIESIQNQMPLHFIQDCLEIINS